MEDMASGLGRFALRMLKWLLIEAVLEVAIYWYGRFTLKVFTLGNYPQKHDEAETRCIVAGIFSAIITIAVIAMLW